jgi:hypothetical protein
VERAPTLLLQGTHHCHTPKSLATDTYTGCTSTGRPGATPNTVRSCCLHAAPRPPCSLLSQHQHTQHAVPRTGLPQKRVNTAPLPPHAFMPRHPRGVLPAMVHAPAACPISPYAAAAGCRRCCGADATVPRHAATPHHTLLPQPPQAPNSHAGEAAVVAAAQPCRAGWEAQCAG